MSEIKFSCHACGQVLQVTGDKAGRKAKCVQCGTILTIPAGSDPLVEAVAAAPDGLAPPRPRRQDQEPLLDEPDIVEQRRSSRDDGRGDRARDYDARDYDEDRPRRRDDRDYDLRRAKASPWERVRLGLLIAFIGLCVMGGAHAVDLLGLLLRMAAPGAGLAVARIAAFLAFLGTIGAIVGHVFCLFVSNRFNLFAYAVAGLAVAGFYLLMQMVLLVMLFNPFGSGFGFVLLMVHLVEAAHFVLIAFFLRALAQQLDDPALEKSTLLPMILAGAHGGYALLTEVIIMSMSGAVDFGRGYFILVNILRLLGAALVVVVFVFILLAVFRGKQLVDRA